MSGKPICSAASRTPATVVDRNAYGMRMPARASTSFINPLSRNVTACSTVVPGAPMASRKRAASTTVGSQRVSTRSMFRPRNASSTVRITASSSPHDPIWMYSASARRAVSGS